MTETTIIKGTAAFSASNTLFDGDFIDLTSENEPQLQNGNEADVVMANQVPRSQTEAAKKSPDVFASKTKLQNPISAKTKQATMIVSSAKTSQQIRFPVKVATNLNGTHILVQQSVGKEIGQLLSQNKSESNCVTATISATKAIPSQLSSGSPGVRAQFSILQNTLHKTSDKVSKNVGGKCNEKSPFKAANLKKLGIKANINPVAMHRYRAIKPAPINSKEPISSNPLQNMEVEDVILVPTSSETGLKKAVRNRYQNVPVLDSTSQPNYDNLSLVPDQSESRSETKIAKKSVSASTSLIHKSQGAVLTSPQNLQNLILNCNNNDDDVIIISDDPKKEETKKPNEIQTVLSLPVNALGQLGSVSSRLDKPKKKTIMMQKKFSEKGCMSFLAPQLQPTSLQAKEVIPSRSPNVNVQNVKIVRPSLSPIKKPSLVVPPMGHPAKALLKTLDHRQSHQNVAVEDSKDIASNPQELEIVEHEVASNCLKDLTVPMEAIAGNIGGAEVYFLVYPMQNDDSSVKAIEDADVDNCTVIPDDDDIELSEPKVEPVFDEMIETEKDDPFQQITQANTIHQSCVVTPVDITEILNQGKAKQPELKDRCDSVVLKNMKLYQRGFTKREMRRACCVRYLQTFIKDEEHKIRQLKKSCFVQRNFIHCGKTLNNFLPETSQCDEGDPDEYVIEYNDIEQRLNEEIYNSQTLPVITNVISKVNEEVLQMKTQHAKTRKRNTEDLQAKLAKPEEALKLIKRGLELIKSWSQETHSVKEKASKSLPVSPKRKSSVVEEPKRKRYSAPIEVVVEPPKKVGRGRGRAKKNEVPQKKEEPKVWNVGSRRRTPTEKVAQAKASEKVAKASVDVAAVKEVRKRKTEASVEVKIPKKRGRKPKNKIDFDSVDDNELFVIKKVDILTGGKRK